MIIFLQRLVKLDNVFALLIEYGNSLNSFGPLHRTLFKYLLLVHNGRFGVILFQVL